MAATLNSTGVVFGDSTAQNSNAYGTIGQTTYRSTAVDLTLTSSDTPVQVINVTASGKNLYLPAATTLPEGTTFSIRDAGRSGFWFSYVYDSGTNAVLSNVSGQTFVVVENNGAKYWSVLGSASGGVIDQVYVTTLNDVWGRQSVDEVTGRNKLVKLSSSSFLLASERQNASGTVTGLYAQAFTVSGSTVTQGTAVLLFSGAGVVEDICALSSTTAFVAYRTDATPGTGVIAPLSISGTTITVGTTANVSTSIIGPSGNSTFYRLLSLATANSTVAVAVFSVGSSSVVTSRAVQYNGTSAPTFGTALNLSGLTASSYVATCTVDTATNKIAFFASEGSLFGICTVSGTTITKGANLALGGMRYMLRNAYSSSEVAFNNGISASISGTTATLVGNGRASWVTPNSTAAETGGTYLLNGTSDSAAEVKGNADNKTFRSVLFAPSPAVVYGTCALSSTRFVVAYCSNVSSGVSSLLLIDIV